MLCWNWNLTSARPTMEREYSSQEYVSLGEQPPQDRAERLWYRLTCCLFTVLMCIVLALVVTGTYYVLHKNAESYSTTTMFSEHTTITTTTELVESKVYNTIKSKENSNVDTSTDILAVTSSTDSNGETSMATVLVTKERKQKIHRKTNNSTLEIPSSEMESIALSAGVEVSKTSVNALYDISTESHVKHKTKKRNLFNSFTNKFEVISVVKSSTESTPSFQSPKRDPRKHKILREVWNSIKEYPLDAINKK